MQSIAAVAMARRMEQTLGSRSMAKVAISLVVSCLMVVTGLIGVAVPSGTWRSNHLVISGNGDNLYLPTSAIMTAVDALYNNSGQNAYNWYNFSTVPSPSSVGSEIAQQANATLPAIESYMGTQNASNLSLELDGNKTLLVATISFVDNWITWSDGVEYANTASWSGPVGGTVSGPLVVPAQGSQVLDLLNDNQYSGGCTPNGGSTSCNWAGMEFYPTSANLPVVTEASVYNYVMQVPKTPGCNGGNCQINVPSYYVSPGGSQAAADAQIANWVSLTGCSGGIGTGPKCGLEATGYFYDISHQGVPSTWHPGQNYFPGYPSTFPLFWGMEGQGPAGLRGMHSFTGYCGSSGYPGVVFPQDLLFMSVYKLPNLYYWYQSYVFDITRGFGCSVLNYAYSGQWANGQFFQGFTPTYADFETSAPFMASHIQQLAWYWTAWGCGITGCAHTPDSVFFGGGSVWTQSQSSPNPCLGCTSTKYTLLQLDNAGLYSSFEMSQENTYTTAYPQFNSGSGPITYISGYVETTSWSANYDSNYV